MRVSVYAMNGKSVEIDNTDAEGRLVLSGKFSDLLTCGRRLIVRRRHLLRLHRVQAQDDHRCRDTHRVRLLIRSL